MIDRWVDHANENSRSQCEPSDSYRRHHRSSTLQWLVRLFSERAKLSFVGLTSFQAWPQGSASNPTVVTVYLDTAWNEVQLTALRLAFTNWGSETVQNANGCNCHVVFGYTTTEGSGTYRITVHREVPSDPTYKGEMAPEGLNGLNRLLRAGIKIHPGA